MAADPILTLRKGDFAGHANLHGPSTEKNTLESYVSRLSRRLDALLAAFPGGLSGSTSSAIGTIVNDAGASVDVVVPGAALGDFVLASIEGPTFGCTISAAVKSADIVTVRVQNETGSSAAIGTVTVNAFVIPLGRASYYGLLGSDTWDPGSLADGAGESKDVTVAGAALGDFVLVSLGVDAQGLLLGAAVKSANTVTCRLQNETGGTVDLAPSRVRVLVVPASVLDSNGVLAASVTHDFASLVDAAGESRDVTVAGAALGDFAIASLSVDGQSMLLTAAVETDDTVRVRLQNETGGTINLAEAKLRVAVYKKTGFSVLAALGIVVK